MNGGHHEIKIKWLIFRRLMVQKWKIHKSAITTNTQPKINNDKYADPFDQAAV